MRPAWLVAVFVLLFPHGVTAQNSADPVQQAIAQGDLFQSKRKYELAYEAYKKADKAAHHTSALAYLKLASVEKKLGDFSSSLDDVKRALKVAGDNQGLATQAHLLHANLLVQMSSKPGDKKLKEAEADVRQAIAVEPARAVAHFNLGYILLRQERDPEGVAELKAFLGMSGGSRSDVAEAQRMIASPIRAREPFAPDFSFNAEDTALISNASLRGTVVLLDFWGTWCPPCRASVPVLQNLQRKYSGRGFQLVGISSDDDEDVWKTFTQANKMNWSEYIDLSGEVLHAFKIESFPTYIVLDKDGVMRFRQSGFAGGLTQMELEEAINKALKRPSDPNLAAAASAAGSAKEKEAEREEAEESSVADSGRATGTGSATGAGSSAAESVADRAEAKSAKDATDAKDADNSGEVLSGIEAGTISAGVYKNEALSLSYEFPRGWIAAKADTLHKLNEKLEAGAKASILQQHPEAAANLRIMTQKLVFYGSRRGDGDGQQLSFPCVRITASPSRADALRLDTFQQMSEAMATASGAKITGFPQKYQVKEHSFLRADLERSLGGQRIWQTFVQTLSEDYLLTIEIYALSGDDKQAAVDSLQKMFIEE